MTKAETAYTGAVDPGSQTSVEPTGTPVLTESQVIPLHTEDIAVSRRKIERNVQVHVRTITHEQQIDEPLMHERFEIERIAIGRPIDAPPPVREEGDTTVISVVEEVVVVERRLVLKEEIHLRRVRTIDRHRETVTLRTQAVVVDRTDRDGRKDHPLAVPAPIPKPQALKEEIHD